MGTNQSNLQFHPVLHDGNGSSLSGLRGECDLPIDHLSDEESREYGDGPPLGHVSSHDQHSAQQQTPNNADLHTTNCAEPHIQNQADQPPQQEPASDDRPTLTSAHKRKRKKKKTKI